MAASASPVSHWCAPLPLHTTRESLPVGLPAALSASSLPPPSLRREHARCCCAGDDYVHYRRRCLLLLWLRRLRLLLRLRRLRLPLLLLLRLLDTAGHAHTLDALAPARDGSRARAPAPALPCSARACVRTCVRQSDSAAACVAEALRAGHPFKEAELVEVQVSAAAVGELVLALASAAPLARLSIADCALGDEGVPAVLPVVRSGGLGALELRSNSIGNHGAASIAEALACNTSLRSLDLQRNHIKCQGAIGLAAALQVNSHLEVLNVRFNEVSDAGATALGKALQANHTLAELHLGGNLVGPEGAVQLATALEANATLRTLNLRSNAILDVGAVALARMCKRNDALNELYLGANGISEEGVAALADSWKTNAALVKVDLQGAAAGRTGCVPAPPDSQTITKPAS